ncbi:MULTISPECIES: hypothetical protein [Olivibacter]|jgi:hypothetical protein|uniref:Uncharacterized protein n=1 Tax=Olivibacter oleidegradans TaxID=760123 RepID=A0ABV6HPD2_9SPHI|nr:MULTISPECIES: hypothetical protein [Olivibacter]MCL4642013.1 hypothetical protein [Olivibacter sp. UJ_SKK_5.1]MDM8173513.1 hypothetical protein [Olivibacter sp. 47]
MAQTNPPVKAANDPSIFKEIRGFLKELNAGDGKPIEQLGAEEARQVLLARRNR